jgi:hypothetical protein
LSRELTFSAEKAGAGGAEVLLRSTFELISKKLSSIAVANRWNLSKDKGREFLRNYISEHRKELEDELGVEFIEW